MKIRPATPGDIDGIRTCVTEAYRHYITRIGKAPGPMIDDYQNRLKNDEVYVVNSEELIIGALVLIVTPERCLLDNVAVLPKYSGRGIGKKLVSFAEIKAAELGFDKIELYTHELMTENIDMYQNWGYEVSKRIKEKGFDRVYMSRAVKT